MPATTTPRPAGWLVGPTFDGIFLFGFLVIGVVTAVAVSGWGDGFVWVLFLNLWLLGYHHVISTFTRLGMDPDARKEHAFLLYGMPFVVAGVCFVMVQALGIWAITTVYLYWQWWHYTRQSWGVSQAYRGRAKGAVTESPRLLMAVHYAVPVWGILSRSAEGHTKFLGAEVWVVPVPGLVVWLAGAVAFGTLVVFMAGRLQQYMEGTLPVAHTIYVVSHLLIFAFGYLVLPDITLGWLAINIWHNAQYIAFVWMFHGKRFSRPEAPQDVLIARLSRPGNLVGYLAFCLLISTAVYSLLSFAAPVFRSIGVSAVFLYAVINFHHYVVDTYIWKLRKPALKRTLELESG